MSFSILGTGKAVPAYILTNDELSTMVETNDEWIRTRTGIVSRPMAGWEPTWYMGKLAALQAIERAGIAPEDIGLVISTTATADFHTPSMASVIQYETGAVNAGAFDLNAACTGFVYALDTARRFLETDRTMKYVLVVANESLSRFLDFTDRGSCILFGDGAAAVLLEATDEQSIGVIDSYFRADGKGLPFLHMKAGGSVCPPNHFTVDHRLHYLYQEGRTVFRYAVTNMSDDCALIAERNGLNKDNIRFVVPHQANIRIIEAVAKRLELPMEKVMVNIEHFGNTSAATIPLALWEYENQLKKGDNLILTAFGAGFVHGASYLKWAYDGKN